jgi:hypothetical protein
VAERLPRVFISRDQSVEEQKEESRLLWRKAGLIQASGYILIDFRISCLPLRDMRRILQGLMKLFIDRVARKKNDSSFWFIPLISISSASYGFCETGWVWQSLSDGGSI